MENSARLSGSSATITSASTWRIAATAWTIAVIIQTKNRNNARTNVADAIDSSATIAVVFCAGRFAMATMIAKTDRMRTT